MSGSELKKCPILWGREKRDRDRIGLCMNTDARESRCRKIHLYNLGGEKKIQRRGRRGGGGEEERSRKIK